MSLEHSHYKGQGFDELCGNGQSRRIDDGIVCADRNPWVISSLAAHKQ